MEIACAATERASEAQYEPATLLFVNRGLPCLHSLV